MEFNIRNAATLFFPNPSFEMLYGEAVRNSIDANATQILIRVTINAFTDHKSLKIEIEDNGDGFTDDNFEKFKKLLEVKEADHKGLGRLVYLHYFNRVDITSNYKADAINKNRKFVFNDSFEGKYDSEDLAVAEPKTILAFTDFRLQKIYSYDNVRAESIKRDLLLQFYPLFYRLKIESKTLIIRIAVTTNTPNLEHDFKSDQQEINVKNLPELKEEVLQDKLLDLLSELKVFYSIKQLDNPANAPAPITAICVDERTVKVDILSKGGTPAGYEIIFILYSNFFTGKVDASRQTLTIDDATLKTVKKVFGNKVAEILNKEIPAIKQRNKETIKILANTYPHLNGLFDENPVGLIDKNESLEIAQSKFFKEQREILNAVSLTEEQYEKSLVIASRILTEYVLYRNIIIDKLRTMDHNSSESDIHTIIVPMKKALTRTRFYNDLYTNNAWLLDDKYMSYSAIFSDREIGELISNITQDDVKDSSLRPDIAIVFSGDPNGDNKVDVVIVELKKLGLDMGERNNIYVQLLQRATKLLKYFPQKIQRIWFYGIVDIDDDFKLLLQNQDFIQLYSNDTVMYKHQDLNLPDGSKVPTAFFIQSFKAMLDDATSRNSTFLNILKEEFNPKTETSES